MVERSGPRRGEEREPSRAVIQALFPLRVLISPLWQRTVGRELKGDGGGRGEKEGETNFC